MKQEYIDKLKKDFPDIFPDKNPQFRDIVRSFEISCDDGWFDLIYKLTDYLNWLIKNKNFPKYKIFQIKEKFGGLRYYIHFEKQTADQKEECEKKEKIMYEIINFTESLSFSICEKCGLMKNVKTKALKSGWICSVCDECREKYELNQP